MLPSDPHYIPAATDERVLRCPIYQDMLRLNTDPYAAHSYEKGLIEFIEEIAFSGGPS
jgi:hypothetical protein